MRIISEHDLQVPLFFYIAFQCNHEPLEAPDEFIEMVSAAAVWADCCRADGRPLLRTVPGDLAHRPAVV